MVFSIPDDAVVVPWSCEFRKDAVVPVSVWTLALILSPAL
jgi:hypothetical protein